MWRQRSKNCSNLRYRADKSVLEAVLADAARINTADYTAASVEAFQAAKLDAERMLADADATQADGNRAAKSLQKAMDSLQPIGSGFHQAAVNGDQALTTRSSNAKTGETSPFATATAVLALAGAGLMLRKKKHELLANY